MFFYIVYIIVVYILLKIDYLGKKDKKFGILTLVVVGIMIIVSGIRYEVGYDYLNYYSFFLNPDSFTLDFGFDFVRKFFYNVGVDYRVAFFFFSFFTIFFLFKGVKKYSKDMRLSLFLYLLVPGLYLNSFSIVRQAIAIVILFWGYRFLLNKEYIKYICVIFLAGSFHYTAFFVIPFFIMSIYLYRYTKLMSFVLIPISIICGGFYQYLFDIAVNLPAAFSRFMEYQTYEDAGNSMIKIVIINLFYFFCLFNLKKMEKNERQMMSLFLFGTVFFNMFASIGALSRIAYYLIIYEIIIVPNFLMKISNWKNRIIIRAVVVLYFCIQYFNAIYVDTLLDYTPKLTPYKTIFQL